MKPFRVEEEPDLRAFTDSATEPRPYGEHMNSPRMAIPDNSKPRLGQGPRVALGAMAGAMWIATAVLAFNEALAGDGVWQSAYALYSVALACAATATAVVALSSTWPAQRRGFWFAGAALTALGLLSTVVAWALPLWMVTIAVGHAVLSLSDDAQRSAVRALSGAQLAGLAVAIVMIEVGAGLPGSYNDYPQAQALGITTTALLTCIALRLLVAPGRSHRRDHSPARQNRHLPGGAR